MTGDEQDEWMQSDAQRRAQVEPLTWLGCMAWVFAGFGVAGLVISALVLTWWVGGA